MTKALKAKVEIRGDDKLSSKMKSTASRFKKSMKGIASSGISVGKALSVGGAAAGILAIKAGLFDVNKELALLDRSAGITGLSVQKFEDWAGALEATGAEADDLRDGIKDLDDKITEARRDKAGALFDLNLEGFNVGDFLQIEGTENRLIKLRDIYRGLEREQRSRLLEETGLKEKFAGLFGLSNDELDGLFKRHRQLLGESDTEARESAKRFNLAFRDVFVSLEGAARVISKEISPVLSDLFVEFANFVSKNKGEIGSAFKEFVEGFEKWISDGSAEELFGKLKGIGESIGEIAEVLGAIGRGLIDTFGWLITTDSERQSERDYAAAANERAVEQFESGKRLGFIQAAEDRAAKSRWAQKELSRNAEESSATRAVIGNQTINGTIVVDVNTGPGVSARVRKGATDSGVSLRAADDGRRSTVGAFY